MREKCGLDIAGSLCDNILAYLPCVRSVFASTELSADPTYDPDANKPWWELAWKAIVNWFVSVLEWWNSFPIAAKILIGLTLLAIACIIAVATGGAGAGSLAAVGNVLLNFMIGLASDLAITVVMAFLTGGDVADALIHGLADGVFFGGLFAFVSASVGAVKAAVRSGRNAKLAQSAQTGSQPCSTVNQCFKEGTLVETEEGLKPIEKIEVGDKVLAYDEQTGEQAYKPLSQVIPQYDESISTPTARR